MSSIDMIKGDIASAKILDLAKKCKELKTMTIKELYECAYGPITMPVPKVKKVDSTKKKDAAVAK